MPLPRADVWRIWATALAFAVMLLLAMSGAKAGTCRASFYGAESGRVTASGQPFHPMGLTAAHRTMRLGTRLQVRLGARTVIVIVNDRGPYVAGRCLDLSRGAARALGFEHAGTAIISFSAGS